MDVAHVGLVHCDPCECKVKGFRAVSSIETNLSKRNLKGLNNFEAMPRPNQAWDHWYEDKEVVPGRSQKQVKCRFCPHIMSYQGNKMLAYL